MIRLSLGFSAFFLLLTTSVCGRPADYFPADDFLPGWKGGEVEKYASASDLYRYLDGGAELYLEYRFSTLKVRQYSFSDHGDITVEIFQFESPEDAFGIFNLDVSGSDINIGQGGRASNLSTGGSVRFWKDTYFVRVVSWQSNPDVRGVPEVAAQIASEKMTREDQLPPWLDGLDKAGFQPAFIRGRIALRQASAGIVDEDVPLNSQGGAAWIRSSERYDKPLKTAALILNYRTEQKAAEAFQKMWDRMQLTSQGAVLVGQRGLAGRKNQTTEGIEQFEEFVVWSPPAQDEVSCVETLETLTAILKTVEN